MPSGPVEVLDLSEHFDFVLRALNVGKIWKAVGGGKVSNVTPVFKSGDKSVISNYRPISLLSIPSKLLKRIVHRRLLHHLLDNSILSPRQFGFRPGSSTQEALLTATYDWHHCLDHGLSTAALFLDLSKAFDRVPHRKVLCTLSLVGISSPLLQWFQSYLSHRSQRVVLNGHSSSTLLVKSCVPQGSILGPFYSSFTLTRSHILISPLAPQLFSMPTTSCFIVLLPPITTIRYFNQMLT